MVEILNEVKEEEWKEFLSKCNSASIYHTPEWKTFLEETFHYKPHYFFMKNESEKIVGFLPMFQIKSKLTGNRLCSLPFAHICGPVGNENIFENLVSNSFNLFKDLKLDNFEIREYIKFDGFYHKNSFSTHILELSPEIKNVWQKLDKGSVRWAIKKSDKSGIIVCKTENIEDLKEFYELNCVTKKELGVPCHPWKFFKNLFGLLRNNISLYVAIYNNEIIAGGIMDYYKDTVLYGYGAANPKYLSLYPYNAFLWKAIEDACISGYKYFDFGRTSYDNSGLINFKKRWGTEEKKLYYSSYPENNESLTENRDNLKYRMGTKAIRNMPMPIYKKFSDVVFGHFG